MQQHLEWLKSRIYISPQMEQELLSQEKKTIIDAYKADSRINTEEKAENYFNKTYN